MIYQASTTDAQLSGPGCGPAVREGVIGGFQRVMRQAQQQSYLVNSPLVSYGLFMQ